jgi:predicted thioesterase
MDAHSKHRLVGILEVVEKEQAFRLTRTKYGQCISEIYHSTVLVNSFRVLKKARKQKALQESMQETTCT